MATVTRVRRLVNPSTSRTGKSRPGKRRSKHRKRFTPAQIKAGFGGKRRQSALKAVRKRKAGAGKSHHAHRRPNPGRPKTRTRVVEKIKWRTRVVKVKSKAKRKRPHSHRNPGGLLVTYAPAMLNPKRRKKVAKTKARRKKSNPRRATRTRVITKYRYRSKARKSNPHRSKHRRRNPGTLMHGGFKSMGTAVVGGLVGVTVTKTVPGMLPATMLGSGLMRVVASAAVAWGAGELASRFVGPEFGRYVFFGGLMQAGSVALNAFIPAIGKTIGLAGLTPSNDILLPYNVFAGRYGAVPQPGNPQMRQMMPGGGFAPPFA